MPLRPHLPAALRTRPRLLIVGCGDVGLRVRAAAARALARAGTDVERRTRARRCARRALCRCVGNLDEPATLARLAGLADAVLHLAPPPRAGASRPAHRAPAAGAGAPAAACGASSTPAPAASTATAAARASTRPAPLQARPPTRARRRVDAERAPALVRPRASACGVTLLRIPGIYALDRAGGHPRERLARGTPVLAAADDVYTNHIHADDLARACVAALLSRPAAARAARQRRHRAEDGRLLRPRRRPVRRCRARRASRAPRQRAQLSPMQLSFMSESRRLDNTRLKRELRAAAALPDGRANGIGAHDALGCGVDSDALRLAQRLHAVDVLSAAFAARRRARCRACTSRSAAVAAPQRLVERFQPADPAPSMRTMRSPGARPATSAGLSRLTRTTRTPPSCSTQFRPSQARVLRRDVPPFAQLGQDRLEQIDRHEHVARQARLARRPARRPRPASRCPSARRRR